MLSTPLYDLYSILEIYFKRNENSSKIFYEKKTSMIHVLYKEL